MPITAPRMYKRILIPVGLIIGACIGVYFTYFHRPPTEDILAANRQRREHAPDFGGRAGVAKMNPRGGKGGDDDDYYYYDEDEDADDDLGEGKKAAAQSYQRWQKFLDRFDYVSIGDLYNKCDGENKVTLGKVVMIPDKKEGGIMSRTFLNTTLKKEITGGEMYLDCSYNGKELYKNHWDLCTVEEGMDDRIIFCPISEGKKKFVKDLKIPNYLPKGRYTTKAWLTNQDDDLLGCAFADFTI